MHQLALANAKDVQDGAQGPSALLNPPLVSIIIINYNYGGFLLQCINSILQQSYSNIEVIIVDNHSTDNSKAVISDLVKLYPEIKILWRPENGGQSIACIEGFRLSKGEYIVFVDADDYLLASFVETHVWVHLSVRIPIGLTSTDMLQSINDQIVLGTRQEISDFICNSTQTSSLLRLTQTFARDIFPNMANDKALLNDVYFVSPANAIWVWSPMSGNCFRRDALNLFIENDDLRSLKLETDTYFILGISCLTGSVLIDRPLAVYRMHGQNRCARHPQINRIISHNLNGQAARKAILTYLIRENGFFLVRLNDTAHFKTMVEEIGFHICVHGDPFFLFQLGRRYFESLSQALGKSQTLIWTTRWGLLGLWGFFSIRRRRVQCNPKAA